MKILKMRATFGKLQSAELALGEGLNVIEAPNEGGKSTWSAFLRAMLYGINTKERDRQGYLAEKNRYQPWSGAAMEGSVELLWQGRSVTLRRGPAELVPGLTGDNAGETLTGVPREVFERSAFVGHGGAAIDGAPALEARIAALASSGEEDVSYSQVERRLRDWLNRRKHNKTGLIPRLEEELADVEETLARQSKAFRLAQEARRELERLQAEHRLLESERDAHLSRAMAQRRARWEAAQAALAEAQAQVDGLEAERTRHGAPPDRDTLKRAQEELNALNTLHANRKLAESQLEEARAAEAEARASAEDPLFPGLPPDEAWERAGADAEAAGGRPKTAGLYAGGILLLAVGAVGLIAPLCGTLPLPLGESSGRFDDGRGVRCSGYRGRSSADRRRAVEKTICRRSGRAAGTLRGGAARGYSGPGQRLPGGVCGGGGGGQKAGGGGAGPGRAHRPGRGDPPEAAGAGAPLRPHGDGYLRRIRRPLPGAEPRRAPVHRPGKAGGGQNPGRQPAPARGGLRRDGRGAPL